MPRSLGVRQLRSRRCGCAKCLATYPEPPRRATKDCSGSWQARYYDETGKRIPITRTRKQDAIDARDAAVAAVKAGTHSDPKRGLIKLSEWYEIWRTGRTVEEHTAQNDRGRWNSAVGPRWGASPLRTITHQKVQTWVAEMERAGLSRNTIDGYVALLRMLLAAAKRDGRIQVNACEGLVFSPQRGRPSAPTRPPTVEEIDLIVSHIAPAGHGRAKLDVYSRIPGVIRDTGLRPEELFGLLPDCIDLDDGWLTVRRVLENVAGRKQLRDYPKSDAGYSRLPLTKQAAQLLAEHMEIQKPIEGRPVFRALRGQYADRHKFYLRWLEAAEAAGVHVEVQLPSGRKDHWPTPYHLRHSYGTRLENAGVPMSIVKLVMGHEKPKQRDVTWRYIHAPEDPAVYGPIVLAALEGEPVTPVGRALRAVA
jgi:integrase